MSGNSAPGWLERTFLYTFGLSGLILLIHTGNIWVQVSVINIKKRFCTSLMDVPGPPAGAPVSPPAVVWAAHPAHHGQARGPQGGAAGHAGARRHHAGEGRQDEARVQVGGGDASTTS